ncbi:MAG: DUF3276 family protein [Alloprevotella sp.]
MAIFLNKVVGDFSKGTGESDILFSKTVKAGKRIYYIDVKQDRHNELYISITESKKIKEGTEEERPMFEKHKIFLYREDLENFMNAFADAAQYTFDNCPRRSYDYTRRQTGYADAEPHYGHHGVAEEPESYDTAAKPDLSDLVF